MAAIIELKNCFLAFQGKEMKQVIFEDYSLTIEKNEFAMIVGRSGCGKSTLLSLAAGLIKPDMGEIIVAGNHLGTMSNKEKDTFRNKTIGFVYQSFQLLYEFSVLENVMIPLLVGGMKKSEAQARATELLKKVNLEREKNKFPRVLSGGEQQRVAFCRAIANEPSIIFADEPTGNLDRKSAEEVMESLKELHEKGKTIVMVTHDENLLKYASRVIYMD